MEEEEQPRYHEYQDSPSKYRRGCENQEQQMMVQEGSKEAADSKAKFKLGLFGDIIVKSTGLLLVVGVFLIPTIFYALPSNSSQALPSNSSQGKDCKMSTVPYSGNTCAELFASVQSCLSGTRATSGPSIPSNIDQQDGERGIMRLLDELAPLNPSPECMERLTLFVCLHVFGICTGTSTYHTAYRQECLRLRDGLCSAEWENIMSDILPECEDLPDGNDLCISGNVSMSSSGQPMSCSDGFYLSEDSGQCRPECGEFGKIGLGLAIVERVAIFFGLIASVVMFVLAFTIQRKNLLKFPTIHLVYLSGSMFLLTAVIIVGFFDNKGFFCGSVQDQIYTVNGNETAYCTITGVVFNYCSAQMSVWLLFHASFLFWAVNFPFHYKNFVESGNLIYGHIASVLLGLLFPLIGALVHLKDGYFAARNPTIICTGRNTDYTYFTFVLPICIILGITSYELLLSGWKILKEFVFKKLGTKRKKTTLAGKAEAKIIVVIFYFTLMGIMGLMSISFYEFDNISNRLDEALQCENSEDKETTCDFEKGSFRAFGVLSVVAFALFALAPVVAILFSFDRKTCKRSKCASFRLSR